LKAPPLIFVVEEWCEIGDCMLHRVLQGKTKDASALGSTWQIVINMLKTMRVEAKVAAAATQLIATPAAVPASATTSVSAQERDPTSAVSVGRALAAVLNSTPTSTSTEETEHRSVPNLQETSKAVPAL